MNFKKVLLSCLFILSAPLAKSGELLKTTTTWEGGDIQYPQGDAEVTSVKLKIEEGELTPFHCHPVPTIGYVLSGHIEVETQDGRKMQFKQGDSVVEVLKTVHRGKALEGPVEIVVFYLGATHIPNTVLPEHDERHQYCNK